LWKNQFDVEALPEAERQKVPLVQIVDRYGDLKKQKKEIEEELDTIEQNLAQTSKDESVQSFFGTKWSVTLKQSESITIPPKSDPKRESIETILKKSGEWENLSILDTTALKKMISQKSLKNEISNALDSLISKEITVRYFTAKLPSNEKEDVIDVPS